MTRSIRLATALLLPLFAAPAMAQTLDGNGNVPAAVRSDSAKPDSTGKTPSATKQSLLVPAIEIQHFRPDDSRGINVFETPKNDAVPFTGFKLNFGAAFTQQWQGLQHANTAAANTVNGTNVNQLITIGHGFNNADANLYMNAQIADGIRVAVTTYASSRHHQETWVKDGYFLVDKSPIDNPILNKIMQYTTLRVGHFEINYGDSHFRRSDNGQTMYNPFVGNLILDAFTTEIGGEAYLRTGPWMAMFGMTGGEVHGQVTAPSKRSPSYLGKAGFDEQFTKDLRVRLTGSLYAQDQSASNTLFTGDRGGSRYYDVMENTLSTEQSNAWSGNLRPGFANSVHAYVVNPFIKYRGAEVFGEIQTATGKASSEIKNRTVRQYAVDGLYRFADDKLYVGGRYNTVYGELAGIPGDVNVNRVQLGGGWFVTPLVLTKIEWVNQKYLNFPTTDIRSGGQFKGFMVEGAVSF